jgi:hypothetical protein
VLPGKVTSDLLILGIDRSLQQPDRSLSGGLRCLTVTIHKDIDDEIPVTIKSPRQSHVWVDT